MDVSGLDRVPLVDGDRADVSGRHARSDVASCVATLANPSPALVDVANCWHRGPRRAPASSSTRASDARRSHRSVEGDKKLCVERVETPILYKRVLLFSPIRSRPVWGWGGLVSDFEHHHHVVHLGLGRASWQGRQGLPPAIATASLPVLARRFRADPHEVGRIEGLGLDSLESGAPDMSRSLQKAQSAIR